MRLAFLTCATWPGLPEKEQALADSLPDDLQAQAVVWNDPSVDWSQYDCLIFRSIWDYFEQPEAFEAWMDQIARLGIPTLNPLSAVRENYHKFYLRTLQARGVRIIPTEFIPAGSGLDLGVMQARGWSQAVLKPAVSGGSYLTRLFDAADAAAVAGEYQDIAAARDLLLQPFIPEIQTKGEVSLLFFAGVYAYAVRKLPQAGDFRVQVQFGGQYTRWTPAPEVIQAAARIIAATGERLLYARVDGVLIEGELALMELELIEPDLYFSLIPEGEAMYRQALVEMVRGMG
ncbi:MAG: hypothetical protein SF053_03880 [Bacteroidia bacterium]|nr:hypothetical protein [Bacteroidia bacterium]